MYEKPQVERFGTFRDLTLVGFYGVGDGCTIVGPNATGSNFEPVCEPRS